MVGLGRGGGVGGVLVLGLESEASGKREGRREYGGKGVGV